MAFIVEVNGQIAGYLGEGKARNFKYEYYRYYKLKVLTYQPPELWYGTFRYPKRYKAFLVTLINPAMTLIEFFEEHKYDRLFIHCTGILDVVEYDDEHKYVSVSYTHLTLPTN